jgi:hypothetical protein
LLHGCQLGSARHEQLAQPVQPSALSRHALVLVAPRVALHQAARAGGQQLRSER